MNEDAAPDTTQVRTGLLEAAAMVGTARSLIAEGKVVDLAGLESRVACVCGQLPSLPAPDRETLKSALIALMDGLGGLAEALNEQHGALAKQLAAVSKGKSAVSAYGAGAATAGPRRKR